VVPIAPFVPSAVHLRLWAHGGDEHGGREDARLVRAGFGEVAVDHGKRLARLLVERSGLVGRGGHRVDEPVVDDALAARRRGAWVALDHGSPPMRRYSMAS